MFRTLITIASVGAAVAFAPFGMPRSLRSGSLAMKLGVDEKVVVIGVAADSGCGKSTFMRRLTKVFGGKSVMQNIILSYLK